MDPNEKLPSLKELGQRLVKHGHAPLCMVITGASLVFALNGGKDMSELEVSTMRKKFFRLGLLCNSVVCCRVSPKQKADVVGLSLENGPWVTLAVGDGANDVSMIMTANIGVGIRGKEGTQVYIYIYIII